MSISICGISKNKNDNHDVLVLVLFFVLLLTDIMEVKEIVWRLEYFMGVSTAEKERKEAEKSNSN